MAEKKKKTLKKQIAKRVTGAKKPVKAVSKAKSKTKPALKKTAPKRTAKATKTVKPAATKTVRGIKALKPDKDYENSTDGDGKIIVLNGKKAQKQQKNLHKQLKRVTNAGGYTAWDGRTGKTFATEKEAHDYAVDLFKRTGEIIAVTYTHRTISHTFKAENKAGK